MNPLGETPRTVRLELPVGLNKKLRGEAAQREVSKATVARILVEDGLRTGKSERGSSK
jgi:hypothetical protein